MQQMTFKAIFLRRSLGFKTQIQNWVSATRYWLMTSSKLCQSFLIISEKNCQSNSVPVLLPHQYPYDQILHFHLHYLHVEQGSQHQSVKPKFFSVHQRNQTFPDMPAQLNLLMQPYPFLHLDIKIEGSSPKFASQIRRIKRNWFTSILPKSSENLHGILVISGGTELN